MRRLRIVSMALAALLISTLGSHAAEPKSFTGTATRSGTFKRPLLDVDGKRYELKPSDKADKSVAELLNKFSPCDTGRYVDTGTRGAVKGKDGIVIYSITPAIASAAGRAPAPTKTVPDYAPSATSAKSEVTSSVVTVGEDR